MKIFHLALFNTLLLASTCACSSPVATAPAQEFSARVVAVLDGDTVLVVRKQDNPATPHAGRLVRIRLAEIDAPEKAQPYGPASRDLMARLVLHRQVRVIAFATGKYGRTIAQLGVDGNSVNEEMVRRGMAWEYSNYHSDRRYIALQAQARRAGLGLWVTTGSRTPMAMAQAACDNANRGTRDA